MVAVQSLGVPWQLTTEYHARAGGMRVRTTGAGTRETSTPGLIFTKILKNAEKWGWKFRIFRHFRANPGMKPTSIDIQYPTCLVNLQSESILLSSFQSYLGFNFSTFLAKISPLKNGNFALKKEIFWQLETNLQLPLNWIWDHRCIFIRSKVIHKNIERW